MKLPKFLNPIKEYSDAYSNATTIPAIGFSKKAKVFLEKWFWMIYFFVFYVIAVFYDFVPQLLRYIDEPTTSKITIIRNASTSMHFPDAQVCTFFWPQLLDIHFDMEDVVALEAFLKHIETEPNITEYIARDILRGNNSLFDDGNTDQKLNASTSNSSAELLQDAEVSSSKVQQTEEEKRHSTLVYLTVAMLSALTRLERSSDTAKTNFEQWGLYLETNIGWSLAIMYRFYLLQNVDFEVLHRYTAAALCAKMGLWMARYNDAGERVYVRRPAQNCQPDMMTSLGHNPTLVETNIATDVLCVKLPSDAIRLKSTHEIFEMIIGPSQIYSGNNTKLQDLTLESHLYFRETDDTNPYMLRLRKASMLFASILGNYVNIPLRRKPCAQHTTREKCRRLCRNNFIVRHCKCRPLTLDDSLITVDTTGLPLCAMYGDLEEVINAWNDTDYPTIPLAKCPFFGNLSESLDPDPECESNCFQSCEHTVFEYHKETLDMADIKEMLPSFLHHDMLTLTQLQMKKFTYPQIEEVKAMRWRDLVGFVGGSFSMWMGINLPVMLHSIIFLVTYLVFKCGGRCKTSTPNQNQLAATDKPAAKQVQQPVILSTNQNGSHMLGNSSLELTPIGTLTESEISKLRQLLLEY